jgi:hypothetical protein
LCENLPQASSSKIKRASASEHAERVSATWKMITGKTVEQSFRKCCITNALDGIENANLWDNSEHGCLGLKSNLEGYVDSEYDMTLDAQVKKTVNR